MDFTYTRSQVCVRVCVFSSFPADKPTMARSTGPVKSRSALAGVS